MGHQTGRVLWFHNDRGFGFIKPQDRLNVVVYFSLIAMVGTHFPETDHLVHFDRVEGPNGPEADKVRIVGKIFSKNNGPLWEPLSSLNPAEDQAPNMPSVAGMIRRAV